MNHTGNEKTRQDLRDELDSLYQSLADKIVEYGNKIRNSSNGDRTELTELLNKLKVNQFKVKQYLVDIDGTENPDWESFKKDAEKSIEDIRNEFANSIPQSV